MDRGDLSGYGLPFENPLTHAMFPNGVIPQSQYSPIAGAVLGALPAPNVPGVFSNNYESAPADSIYNDKGDFRGDHYVNSSLTLFARYSQFDTRIFSPPNIPGPVGGNANGNVYVKTKQGVAGATWTINPSTILEARLGIDYTRGGKTPSTLGTPTTGFTIPNEPTDPSLAGGLFSVGLSGFSGLGRQSSNPQYQDPFVGDPKVNFTKIWGRHSIKTGFEFQLIDTAVSDFHPQYGVENFTGFFSDPDYFTNPSALNNLSSTAKAVYSLADFIFGAPSHYELDNNPIAHYRQRMYFGYVQDDFKASAKLTLNLGMRYEFATPQYERDNKLANFDPVNNTMIYATGGSLYNRALVHPDHNNWAPRVGLAYQVLPKTVIRAGYGISYVQFNRMGGENLLAYNGPNIVDAAIDQIASQPLCADASAAPGSCFRSTAQGFPANFASPQAFNTAITQVRYIPGDNRTGYVQAWHFTIQRELPGNVLLDVAYVGNHDVGLTVLSDANQALPNLPGQSLSLQQRRPIQTFSGIEIAFDRGFGSYNGLQAKIEKRYTSGLYLLNSFTWSKAIDNGPGHLENYDGDNSRINYYNNGLEKGISSYNQPLNDTLSIIYDVPVGRGRRHNIDSKALDMVIGGWGLNLINTMTSGLPLNIGYSPTSQAQISNLVSARPNAVPGISPYLNSSNPVNYLNQLAFSVPSFTQPFGNVARNSVKGPSFYEADFGIHKNFNFAETRYVQFRAEAFNLLNQTNFAPPSGLNSNSSGFGVFTSTFPARQVQLALKLIF
ncbi:MAG: TonB-dependent receptor [Ignavibacteriota bacterium]